MKNIYETLSQMLWTVPNSDQSKPVKSFLLEKLDCKHGFVGKNETLPGNLLWTKQVHGNEVYEHTNAFTPANEIEADASFTSLCGASVSVRTADCTPILLAHKNLKKVAAVHAGWRGLFQGVINQTVLKFDSPENLFAAIGPTISRERFEVGSEVVETLLNSEIGLSTVDKALIVSKGNADRWHIDLPLAAALVLIKTGVPAHQIEVIQTCTMSSPEKWHSYRRDGQGCGSNWSWIMVTSACNPKR